jgi:hypothetical protein
MDEKREEYEYLLLGLYEGHPVKIYSGIVTGNSL